MLSTYIFSPDAALSQVFDKTKDQKIIESPGILYEIC